MGTASGKGSSGKGMGDGFGPEGAVKGEALRSSSAFDIEEGDGFGPFGAVKGEASRSSSAFDIGSSSTFGFGSSTKGCLTASIIIGSMTPRYLSNTVVL